MRPPHFIGTLNPEYGGSVDVATELVLGCVQLGIQADSAEDA
jgi:hypothetical protein